MRPSSSSEAVGQQIRLADRYNPTKDIGPGHPVYERVKAEYAAEQRRLANDPARIQAIRDSIDRKVEGIRRQVEWEKKQELARSQDTPPDP